MKIIWKVRTGSAEGLVESEFRGSLIELAQAYADRAVVVIQAVGIDQGGAQDTAKGGDSVAIEKTP